MTPEEIRQNLQSLAPWFQCIDLGNGLKTKTESAAGESVDHPAGVWEKIRRCLPEDLSGKSVLDVGCNAGFYAIEAKRRKAARVVGVDAQRHHIRQALFVRRVLRLDIDYRRLSVYDLNRRSLGQFDVTLALGLIYHCKHLVLALERLYEVTRELLILETAILPAEQTPESFTDVAAGPSVMLHPLVYAENLPEQKEQVFNWFLPGINALEALLSNVGFEDFQIFDLKRDRAIVVCRKPDRVREGKILSQLGAELFLLEGPEGRVPPGAGLRFRIRAKNVGNAPWMAHEDENRRAVRLGAHLLRTDGEEVQWDYGRAAPLESEVEPDQEVSLWIELTAPTVPGRYTIEFDMVFEHLTWFEDLGTRTIRQPIEIV
jgi:tRNA (mo5U34)-methyltransferase